MSDGFTWHGGRLAQARATYGGDGEPWIDLSTGINPTPWPGVEGIAPDWRSLPDPAAIAALESEAARHFGVSPSLVCAVPGSEIGLRIVGQLIEGDACHLTPCYRTHEAAFAGSTPVRAPEEAPVGSALLLANPNNPDGRLLSRERMRDLLARQDGAGGWLVVDEAFADCMPSWSIAPELGDDRRLVVLRSFGKFFGLAGVRLGFVLGPPDIIAGCRRVLGDWPVSAAAVAFGAAAYRDRDWIERTVASLRKRAAQMDALLARHGMVGQGACPLFRLVTDVDAAGLFDRLARRAILTRPFDAQPGWLRLGLPPDEAAMERLDRVLGDA